LPDQCQRLGRQAKGRTKMSQEVYNYVVLKVTNVNQVTVDMNMMNVNGTYIHAVFQICCIGSIPGLEKMEISREACRNFS